MQLKNSKGQVINVEEKPFAHGGEGDVHRVVGSLYADCCVKIFHEGKIAGRKAKLEYMIKHPLATPANSIYRICWPMDFVYKGQKCVGFLMTLAFPDSHSLYDIYLKEGSILFKRETQRGMLNRLRLLYNISNAINNLHVSGYVLTDFKPQNILFTDKGKISMIDMDSVQIVTNGVLKFGSTAFTLEYAYPREIGRISAKQPLSTAWDVYGYGIVVYQMLMGIHPFTASTNVSGISTQDQLMSNNLFPFGPRRKDIYAAPPPHYYYTKLDKSLRLLFVKTFDLTKNPPRMSEWKDILKKIIQEEAVYPNTIKADIKSGKPLFFLLSDIPENCNINDIVTLEWKTFNCHKLIVNGQDRTNVSSTRVSVPDDRTIEIVASNAKNTTIKKIVFAVTSLFCTQCGTKYANIEDKYCTHCGAKRE